MKKTYLLLIVGGLILGSSMILSSCEQLLDDIADAVKGLTTLKPQYENEEELYSDNVCKQFSDKMADMKEKGENMDDMATCVQEIECIKTEDFDPADHPDAICVTEVDCDTSEYDMSYEEDCKDNKYSGPSKDERRRHGKDYKPSE